MWSILLLVKYSLMIINRTSFDRLGFIFYLLYFANQETEAIETLTQICFTFQNTHYVFQHRNLKVDSMRVKISV